MIVLFILLSLKITNGYVNEGFNGTLTQQYLLDLGYTLNSDDINLYNNTLNITSIAPFTFSNFTKLRNLSLSFDTLETVPSTAFRGIKSLENLNLYFIGIKIIENNSFIDS